MSLVLVEMILTFTHRLVCSFNSVSLFPFLSHLFVGLILTRVKLYAFWKFQTLWSACLWNVRFLRPASFLCFMRRLLPDVAGNVDRTLPAGALHWLQINVLPMFLPLLEILLYFLRLCCRSYIHLLEKGYLLENILLQLFDCKFRLEFCFCHAVYHITKKLFSLFASLSFVTSPKRLSIL